MNLSEMIVDPADWAEGGSYYVVDLDAATPVLLLPIAPSADEPEAPVNATSESHDENLDVVEDAALEDESSRNEDLPDAWFELAPLGYASQSSEPEEVTDVAILEVILAEARLDDEGPIETAGIDTDDDFEFAADVTAAEPEEFEIILGPVAVPESVEADEPGESSASPLEPKETTPVLSGYAAGESDIDSLTCHDCVFEVTCPSKGERAPSGCGSFQWVTQ